MYIVKRRLVVSPILFYTYMNRTDRVPGAQTRGSGFRGPDSAKSSQIDEIGQVSLCLATPFAYIFGIGARSAARP